MKRLLQKPFVLFVILAFGLVVAVLLVKNKTPLEHVDSEMARKKVEIITVKNIPFRTRVTAYGNVEPSILVKGMAQVSGKASYVHPLLKQGNSLPAGTTVVRIDPQDYQVSLKQTQADLSANQSTLKQLQEEEKSTQQSMQFSKRNLQVGEQELERIRGVYDKKLVSRSVLDAEEQKVLQLRQQVEELQGKLNTFDSRKASVSAQIERAEQQVKGQKTTLGRTEIKLPFDARIGNVSIQKGEFVGIGTELFQAIDIKGVEINAQLPIIHMRSLVGQFENRKISGVSRTNNQDMLQSLNLVARVRLVGNIVDTYWTARVLRLSESIDPTRRTLGIVVGVDNPYDKVVPGKRPPLLKGMYTAVDIHGPEHMALVVPRKAVHQGRVYTVSNENRLAIKPVKLDFNQGELVVIDSGLQEGEQVIISDVVPVIDGMRLEPIEATDYLKNMLKTATGSVDTTDDRGIAE